MAEAVLFDVMKELLKKLGSQVIQEIGLWYGFKEELSKLRNTVSVIQTVLLDAEEQHAHNNQVKKWLGKLKEVVYDADDLLDEFSAESLNREFQSGNKITKEVRIFFSSSNQVVYGIKMGHKVKGIRERLDEIASERKFHLETRVVEKPFVSIGRDQTHSFVRDEDVIGRDEDKKNISELLLDVNVKDNVLVIPIVGIGGLGKTTLAQNVYNDVSVKSCFEVRMWVCVSEPFDVKEIIEKMIRSASGREVGNLDMDQLQSRFRKEIDGKKYLLVLDDVWNDNRIIWLDLERLLMGGANGSRIIVTTRSKSVASVVSVIEPYVLSGLSEEGAWDLFTRLAFKKIEDSYNEVVVDIGKKIVKRCAGVPLAIKTIGSLLYSKDPKNEWVSFESKEFSNLTQKGYDILPTLRLSYDHLPSHLKNCFAYCKLFPKDYEIDVQNLICLWMAQGFIESFDNEICLGDIGLEYFKNLLWRSFFQEVRTDELGSIVGCKMHDLMHDLAISVGGTESVLLQSTEICNEKTRHMSIESGGVISKSLVRKVSNIRSLLTSRSSISESVFSSLTCMRTLTIKKAKLINVPQSIGKLRHLRYLDLSWNNFHTLPSSLTKLQNLQTLHLEYCFYLQTLPVNFNKLKRLVYLNVKDCSSLREFPIEGLTSLETLEGFRIRENNHFGLAGLYRLNKLGRNFCIGGLANNKKNDAADCLIGKRRLQSLQLYWAAGPEDSVRRRQHVTIDDGKREEIALKNLQPHLNLKMLEVDDYRGVMFATWLSSLTNLVKLELTTCSNLKHLPRLDRLTCLRTFKVDGALGLEYVEEEHDVNRSNGSVFPSLENLTIDRCPNLKGWWKRSDYNDEFETIQHSHCYFTRLSTLSIEWCPNLKVLPSFPCLEGRLLLRATSGKPLLQTMSCLGEIPQNHAALSKMTHLELDEIHDIASMPGEWFRGWNCLKSLVIKSCKSLSSLPGLFQHLTSLEELHIECCSNLNFSVDQQWNGLRSLSKLYLHCLPHLISLPYDVSALVFLQQLKIYYCPNLVSLPQFGVSSNCLVYLSIEGCGSLHSMSGIFQHMTSLEGLSIGSCTNLDFSVDMQWKGLKSLSEICLSDLPQLISLPDGISTLTSLKQLEIYNCSNLISLPDGISTLTSLQKLRIVECPNLWERCRFGTGEEWHKIAHIPKITNSLVFLFHINCLFGNTYACLSSQCTLLHVYNQPEILRTAHVWSSP